MIRVLIADEVKLTYDALTSVLEAEEDFKVVGRVGTKQDLEHYLGSCSCEVLVISAALTDGRAFELLNAAKKAGGEALRYVVVGVPDVQEHVMAFIECGVDGYVVRDSGVEELIRVIRAVHREEPPLPSAMVRALMQRVSELSNICDELAANLADVDLTARECDVLDLLADDLSNAEIAEALNIEVGTVKTHVHNILSKLGVANRREAAHYAPLVAFQSPQKAVRKVSEWTATNGYS